MPLCCARVLEHPAYTRVKECWRKHLAGLWRVLVEGGGIGSNRRTGKERRLLIVFLWNGLISSLVPLCSVFFVVNAILKIQGQMFPLFQRRQHFEGVEKNFCLNACHWILVFWNSALLITAGSGVLGMDGIASPTGTLIGHPEQSSLFQDLQQACTHLGMAGGTACIVQWNLVLLKKQTSYEAVQSELLWLGSWSSTRKVVDCRKGLKRNPRAVDGTAPSQLKSLKCFLFTAVRSVCVQVSEGTAESYFLHGNQNKLAFHAVWYKQG